MKNIVSNIKRIVIMTISIAVLFCAFSINIVQADEDGSEVVAPEQAEPQPMVTHEQNSAVIDPDDYKPNSLTSVTGAGQLMTFGNKIIGVIRAIGTVVSVGTLIIIGIKYMLGGIEEKAEYKKTLMPYFIGAIMVFTITNLLAIVTGIVTTMQNAS